MDRLVYTALASISQLDNIKLKSANALANASTTGFKQAFSYATRATEIAGVGFGSRYVPTSQSSDLIDIDRGPLVTTGRKLDLYMRDATVMGVQGAGDQVAFTRRGDLTITDAGFLATANGHLVMGEGGGPITTPAGLELMISDDGTVRAMDLAFPDQPPSEIAVIMLRDSSETQMVLRPDGLFEPITQRGQGGDFDSGPVAPSVNPGALEGSSVNVAEQLVKFMDISRSFEIRVKMISEMKSLDDTGSSMIRMA